MLTYGQASCLVLGLKMNEENKKMAILRMKEIGMEPTYINGADPYTPTAVATIVQQLNPIKYCQYPNPESNTKSSNQQHQHQEQEQQQRETNFDSSSQSFTSDSSDAVVSITKEQALDYLKIVLSKEEPSNNEMYEKKFITSSIQHTLLKEHYGNINISQKIIAEWVNGDLYFDKVTSSRSSGSLLRGRWLYKLKDTYIDLLPKATHELYRKHISSNNMTNIGYVRKSKTHEDEAQRLVLLQRMIDKLYSRYYCSKIYASPYSDSHQKIKERDKDGADQIVEKLKNCQGNTQDMIHRLKSNLKDVRLVIIDFAGLSTSSPDIKHFLRKYKQIKEVVVDHGISYDVFTRADLINDDSHIMKFNSRKGNVKRST